MKLEVSDDIEVSGFPGLPTQIKQEVTEEFIDVCSYDEDSVPSVFNIDQAEYKKEPKQNNSYRYPQRPESVNIPFAPPLSMFLPPNFLPMFPRPWMFNPGMPLPINPYFLGFPGLLNSALLNNPALAALSQVMPPPTNRSTVFQCRLCRYMCGTESQLASHTKLSHSDKPETFTCETCDKEFYGRTTLTRHIKHVHEERQFECKHCHKKFSKRWNLRIHLNIHTGDKPYSCGVCTKSFGDPNNLRQHKRSCMSRNNLLTADS